MSENLRTKLWCIANEVYSKVDAEDLRDYNPDLFKGKAALLLCDAPKFRKFTRFSSQNFDRFGLKKLIRTSYASYSKVHKGCYQVTMFEEKASHFIKIAVCPISNPHSIK